MKKLILFAVFLHISLFAHSQETSKTLDVIYQENGEIIETRIIRVNKRKIFYLHPKTFEILQIDRDEVQKYEFNDDFFKTNSIGELEHKEVIWLEEYKKDEIYRAIKDWYLVNSSKYGSGIYLEDTTHFIILGTINTAEYLKYDFATVMSMMSEEQKVQTYSLYYDVNVRIKDNRFKIYISDFEISSNNAIYSKALFRSYEKRKTVDGIKTIHGTEIINLKKMIKDQIAEIKNHCKLVRLNDTYHNQIVKLALMDDDW